MKKILMRAGMSPLKNYEVPDVLQNNLIGNNIGNMLFPHSVMRAVMCEDTEVVPIVPTIRFSEKQVQKINEEYDMLLLPFANAFRKSYMDNLESITALVRRLTIPCVVVGVGAQAGIGKEIENPRLDRAVTDFMSAVLEKSSIVGVRGEFTAKYLETLGFHEERDFTVIGCPSMFLYGAKLPEMNPVELTPDTPVSINSKIQLSGKFHQFMEKSRKVFHNYHYVPQVIEEIRMMYWAEPLPDGFTSKIPKSFPASYRAEIYRQGNALSFVNVPSWLSYLEKKEFSFGSRIHGNIAAILAGTPVFIMVPDERIRELAVYHGIPHMLIKEIKKETDIFKLYEKADFSAIYSGHEKRFRHYLDFLHKNGVETIYDHTEAADRQTPFDRVLEQICFTGPLLPYAQMDKKEQRNRKMQASFPAQVHWKLRNRNRKEF